MNSVLPIRILGNRVLLQRIEDGLSKGGIVAPDFWKHGSTMHKVLAVGPGGWAWNRKKNKRHWECPPVQPGDTVLSFHATRASEHPNWKEPVYLDHADGRGRVVVDSRFIELAFNQQETHTL